MFDREIGGIAAGSSVAVVIGRVSALSGTIGMMFEAATLPSIAIVCCSAPFFGTVEL